MPPDRLEAGMVAARSVSLALALAVFAVGFSLDDLRVLRIPGYWLGLGGALVLLALGPLWLGHRFARDHLHEEEKDYLGRVARLRRAGALALLATGLLFVAWLAVFSSGVPPWAR